MSKININKLYILLRELTGTNLTNDERKKLDISQCSSISKEAISILNEIITSSTQLSYSQFNEILLLFNLDRITNNFFSFFFLNSNNSSEKNRVLPIENIEKGVRRFQKYAMLRYGNFRRAFINLNFNNSISTQLFEYDENRSIEIIKDFKDRKPKLVDIDKLSKDEIYFVGYLCGTEIDKILELYEFHLKILKYIRSKIDITKKLTINKIQEEFENIINNYFDNEDY